MNTLLQRETIDNKEEYLIDLIDEFISNSLEELETEGAMCLDMCKEEDVDYNMTFYCIDGTYTEVQNFLMQHYHKDYIKEMCNIIIIIIIIIIYC